MGFNRGIGIPIDVPGCEEPVNTWNIVQISDSFIMEDVGTDQVGDSIRMVETGQPAKDFLDAVIKAYPGSEFVRTSKRGGDYINARYIDQMYSNELVLEVNPKDMNPNVRTTYTGTEMDAQLRDVVEAAQERMDSLSEAEKEELDHRHMGWQLAHGNKYVQDPESGKITRAQMPEKQATSGRRLPDISGIEGADVPYSELSME